MVAVASRHIDIQNDYLFHPDHRNGTQGKSQWTIDQDEEFNCVTNAIANSTLSLAETFGWGLHLVNGLPEYLGVGANHGSQVFVAKFKCHDGVAPRQWHGYPADHAARDQDIPPSKVLLAWRNAGFLTKAKASKILLGKRCSL